MGKGKPKSKGTKLQLGEFLGDNAGNTVNIGGKTVEMPSAPKAATLEIDITKVPNRWCISQLPPWQIRPHITPLTLPRTSFILDVLISKDFVPHSIS